MCAILHLYRLHSVLFCSVRLRCVSFDVWWWIFFSVSLLVHWKYFYFHSHLRCVCMIKSQLHNYVRCSPSIGNFFHRAYVNVYPVWCDFFSLLFTLSCVHTAKSRWPHGVIFIQCMHIKSETNHLVCRIMYKHVNIAIFHVKPHAHFISFRFIACFVL